MRFQILSFGVLGSILISNYGHDAHGAAELVHHLKRLAFPPSVTVLSKAVIRQGSKQLFDQATSSSAFQTSQPNKSSSFPFSSTVQHLGGHTSKRYFSTNTTDAELRFPDLLASFRGLPGQPSKHENTNQGSKDQESLTHKSQTIEGNIYYLSENSDSLGWENDLVMLKEAENSLITNNLEQLRGCVQDLKGAIIQLHEFDQNNCNQPLPHVLKEYVQKCFETFLPVFETLEKQKKITPFIEHLIVKVNKLHTHYTSRYFSDQTKN